jgi:hypothetical protein
MLVAVPGFVLAIFAIAFSHTLNARSGTNKQTDTIMTWTCRFRNADQNASDFGIEPIMSNDAFGKLCDESVSSLVTSS